jgi:hypothetical protein
MSKKQVTVSETARVFYTTFIPSRCHDIFNLGKEGGRNVKWASSSNISAKSNSYSTQLSGMKQETGLGSLKKETQRSRDTAP